jgi:hypothetical protein
MISWREYHGDAKWLPILGWSWNVHLTCMRVVIVVLAFMAASAAIAHGGVMLYRHTNVLDKLSGAGKKDNGSNATTTLNAKLHKKAATSSVEMRAR